MKIAARILSGEACDVFIERGHFASIKPRREKIIDLPWIAPGLIDIQVNGFGGIDFNRAIESDEAWRHATGKLYAHGCTGFLIALITNTEDGYRERLRELTALIRREPRNCLGFHMEGPWLNPEPGYRGAHNADWMQKPSVRLLDEWRAMADSLVKLVTLAPEIDVEASVEVIRAGAPHGIRFFVGHSGAMGATLTRAREAGAAGWTHLGNASPASAPKFENVLLHALAQPGLLASLIPDGQHVPPHAFRALAQALGPRLLLTTDAMAGAAANGPGAYTLGETQVTVGADGSARLPDSGRLAGSTLTPFEGVFRAEQMAGLYLDEAWRSFSTRPADVLGLSRRLEPGDPADFCLISPDKTPDLLATYHRGECVYEAP
jgi:N-acetylglucosamine-6-phosphate deacetylase